MIEDEIKNCDALSLRKLSEYKPSKNIDYKVDYDDKFVELPLNNIIDDFSGTSAELEAGFNKVLNTLLNPFFNYLESIGQT